MYELYSSGMCLVSIHNGTLILQDENGNRLQLPGCGQGLLTVGGVAQSRRPSYWVLMSLVIYLTMMTQLVPRQILCNG